MSTEDSRKLLGIDQASSTVSGGGLSGEFGLLLDVEEFASYLSEVTDGDLWAPTPCSAWAIEDLYQHMLEMNAALAGVPVPASAGPGWPGDGHRDTMYRRIARSAVSALAVATAAARGRYIADTLIHTWDLARALEFDFDVPGEGTLSIARAAIRRVSERERGQHKPYGEVPDFPALSSLEEILVLSGRIPK